MHAAPSAITGVSVQHVCDRLALPGPRLPHAPVSSFPTALLMAVAGSGTMRYQGENAERDHRLLHGTTGTTAEGGVTLVIHVIASENPGKQLSVCACVAVLSLSVSSFLVESHGRRIVAA